MKMENALFMKKMTKQSTLNFSANTLENLLEINWNSMEPNKELEKAIESKFLTPQKFAIEIEKIVAEEKLIILMLLFITVKITVLRLIQLLNLFQNLLKERLKWDATRLNFMKATSKAKTSFIISYNAYSR